MAGLAILKHTFDQSDEELCARWIENPYFQYLCGEEFFCHELTFDRSSLTRWRQRMGEERIEVLLQESLSVAVRTGAMKPQDTRRVIVDTTVQPKIKLGLALHRETELYLGLVHHTDGVEGTKARIAAAQNVVSHFGVATECGTGRRPAGTMTELLRVHAAVAQPIEAIK